MGFDEKSQKGEIHNYKNDYKFTYELKQKANGEWQVGGKIRSDNEDGLADFRRRQEDRVLPQSHVL